MIEFCGNANANAFIIYLSSVITRKSTSYYSVGLTMKLIYEMKLYFIIFNSSHILSEIRNAPYVHCPWSPLM